MLNSKYLSIVSLSLLFAVPVQADAQSLGRLFTTPAQRIALERQRTSLFEELAIEELRVPEEPAVVTDAPAELGYVQLAGIVRRVDGQHTIWLNNVPIDESELPTDVKLAYQDGSAVLLFLIKGNFYTLKPGQSLDAASGLVRESFDVTPEQSEAIRMEVEARAERIRLQSSQRINRAVPDSDNEPQEENSVSQDEAMVQSVIEGLRILQEVQALQDAQGAAQ